MLTDRLSPPYLDMLAATVIADRADPIPNTLAGNDQRTHTPASSSELEFSKNARSVTAVAPAPIRSLDDGVAMQQDAEQSQLRSRLQTASILSLVCMTAFFLRSLLNDEPIVLVIRSVALVVTVGCLGLLVLVL